MPQLSQTNAISIENPGAKCAASQYGHTALATSRSRIVLVSLEDALGVEERPNVPGTTTEWPNWRLALPTTLGDIERADGVQRLVEAMKASGRG